MKRERGRSRRSSSGNQENALSAVAGQRMELADQIAAMRVDAQNAVT